MAKKPQPTEPAGFADHYKKVIALIEGIKTDNLIQFGEAKKEFGGINKQLDDHGRRLSNLEADKIGRDAVDKYKKSHSDSKQSEYTGNRKQAGDDSGVTINKELLTALKYLGLVVAALAAAILAMKASP